jgi:hypothetical protein
VPGSAVDGLIFVLALALAWHLARRGRGRRVPGVKCRRCGTVLRAEHHSRGAGRRRRR